MITDSIADVLVQIRNANVARHEIVKIPVTKMAKEIARTLKEEGVIKDFEIYHHESPFPSQKSSIYEQLIISLRYNEHLGRPFIRNIVRGSKPGLRKYYKAKNLPMFPGICGLVILSTSEGVMSERDAKQRRIGGEFVCLIE